ncbi:hypothetical protein [Soonwooa sp.]|uniref:hypothetical protein n=1 Tax=Soonwooa sp. TaxID=1938592 RepID=UPI00260770BC|nr:hypothetical protein [Soonwooa sp.]
MKTNKMEKWKILFYVFAFPPIAFIFFLFLFYFHATFKLGFFPTYDNPDPKQLDFYQIYYPIILAFGGVWLMSLIIWIPLILFYLIIYKKRTDWKPIIICVAFNLMGFLTLFINVIEWFAD